MCDGISEAAAVAGTAAAAGAGTAAAATGISLSTALAIGGLATSVIGGGISYMSSQNAAAAARSAAADQRAAQSTAFNARNQAQLAQTTQQSAVQDASQRRYAETVDAMRTSQDTAQQQRQQAVDKLNTEAEAVRNQVDQNVQQTTQKTITPQTMDQAQAASEAARSAGVQPTVQDIRASSPLGTGANEVTKSALAERMAQAADYTQQYSNRLAKLGAYSAPVTETGLATRELGTNLMPAALADKLLTSGTSARLLPASTAYQNATDYGKSAIAANTAATGEQMAMTTNRAQSAIDIANLGQADANANIQTGLNAAQARAAALNSLGQGAQAIGNAGLMFGASKGAFADLFGGNAGSAADVAANKAYQAGAFSAVPAGSVGPFQ
jgi:hypothetical protein